MNYTVENESDGVVVCGPLYYKSFNGLIEPLTKKVYRHKDHPEGNLTIKRIATEAYNTGIARGFFKEQDSPYKQLSHAMSELGEAFESMRKGENGLCFELEECNGVQVPFGVASELADVIISVSCLAGMLNIDIEKAVKAKLEYNKVRPCKRVT